MFLVCKSLDQEKR